jgi:hypothetical protein
MTKEAQAPQPAPAVPPIPVGEERVLELLAEAWNAFTALEPTHPSDAGEFHAAIHRAQDVNAARLVRTIYPDTFPTRRNPQP